MLAQGTLRIASSYEFDYRRSFCFENLLLCSVVCCAQFLSSHNKLLYRPHFLHHLIATMAKTTLLAGLFLLGLTLIYADGTANDRCDYASFFLLDVSIQPGNGNFDCDGPKDQIKLNKLIKRISDRQFEKYFNETSYMANMTMEEGDLCQGTNGITNRPALRGTNEDRRDLVRLGVAGFLYTTSSQCRFCLEGTFKSCFAILAKSQTP